MKKVILPFGKEIFQSQSSQGISSDTASFIEFVLDEESYFPKSVLDIGTGCGIIPIMLKNNREKWRFTAIDIQNNLIDIALVNDNNISFICEDLKTFSSENKFDLIVSNPPYFPKNKGRISPIPERAIARHEIKMTLIDLISSIKRNLSKNGTSYILYPDWRSDEIISVLKSNGFKVEKQKLLSYNNNEKNRLIMKLKYA